MGRNLGVTPEGGYGLYGSEALHAAYEAGFRNGNSTIGDGLRGILVGVIYGAAFGFILGAVLH